MKRIIFLTSILLIFFLAFSAVQAADGNTTFETIQDNVQSNVSDTIILEGTYYGSGNEIKIDKPLTIKAVSSKAQLNANSKSRIFNIQSDNVTIENIEFFNGYVYEQGGAIYISGNNIRISNCNFINNNVDLYGAGILSDGNNITITNCQFIKNTAKYTGGAFQLNGDDNRVDNCIFERNVGGHVGGAVAWVGNNGILTNCLFELSGFDLKTASQYGGAVAWMGVNGTLTKSKFYYNNAKKSGAAVYWRGENGSLSYCIFEENSALNDIAYGGNPDYANANYWGMNLNGQDEFIQNKLIYYNETSMAPADWVNINYGDGIVEFKLNNGNKLDDYLPDYYVSDSITLSNNVYEFKKDSAIVADNKIVFNNGEYYQIILKSQNLKLYGRSVKIIINNDVYNVKTANDGIAKVKLKTLKPGRYVINCIFGGDDNYKSCTKLAKLTVKKQKTSLKIKVKKKSIKVTLKNQFKKVLAKKQVRLTINKKIYKAKTNKNGFVTFKVKNMNKGKFTVKFKGDSYYKGSSKKGHV